MESLNAILQIPERCLLNKKITKAFFKRNFELSGSEKALLDDYSIVITMDWLASLSPASANIDTYRDRYFLFEEIEIISVQTAESGFEINRPRIADLVQKYIPYPILLCIWSDAAFVFSGCDKKINQNDIARRTIDKKYGTEIISRIAPTRQQQDFISSLAYANLDKTNLKTCYDSYTQRIIALQAAELSGKFEPRTRVRTQSDMEMLKRIGILQGEIQALQNQARKESQLNLRVALNTEIQLKRKEIEQLKALITA
jgi:hypothetical protein